MQRLAVGLATVTLALSGVLTTSATGRAATVTLPDLQILVPTHDISIGTNPQTSDRQLQFTHITWDAGQGPFAIQPTYDAKTGTASFKQVVYQMSTPGHWTVSHDVALAVDGIFLPPSDYRYPLTRFTLNHVNGDGSVGALVATSPKVDYCITADTYVGGVVNTPSFPSPPQDDCANPTKLLGLSVGWGDEYDQTDNGQPIDLSGIPAGTYVLQATVDPDHLFTESNRDNDVVDTKLQITGDSVTVLSQTQPTVVPPTVTLVSPLPGATVKGGVTLTASPVAASPATVTSVQFLLNGEPLGPPVTAAPWSFDWPTESDLGTQALSAQVTDSTGMTGTAPVQSVTVVRTHTPGINVDAVASGTGHGTVKTGAISTTKSGDTLVAFAALDGPLSSAQATTVSGAGLHWRLVRRSNGQAGDAEVWTATSRILLHNVHLTSTPRTRGYAQQLTVYAFSGSRGIGASSVSAAGSGAPSVGVTTTGAASEVFAVGSDWDQAIARTPGSDETVLRQWVDTGDGDTFWVQGLTSPVGATGTHVVIDDTSPTTDRWDLSAVELTSVPLTPGVVRFINPAPGEVLSGQSPLAISLVGAARLRTTRILIDGEAVSGVHVGSDNTSWTWNTTSVPNGRHVLDVRTTDAVGRTVGTSIVVRVRNPRPAMTCFVVQGDTTATGRGHLRSRVVHTASTGERLVVVVDGATSRLTSEPSLAWTELATQGEGTTRVSLWTSTVRRGESQLRVSARSRGNGFLTVLALEGTDGIGRLLAATQGSGPRSALRTEENTSLVVVASSLSTGLRLDQGWVPLAQVHGRTVVAYTSQPISRSGTNVTLPTTRGRGVLVAVELPGDGG